MPFSPISSPKQQSPIASPLRSRPDSPEGSLVRRTASLTLDAPAGLPQGRNIEFRQKPSSERPRTGVPAPLNLEKGTAAPRPFLPSTDATSSVRIASELVRGRKANPGGSAIIPPKIVNQYFKAAVYEAPHAYSPYTKDVPEEELVQHFERLHVGQIAVKALIQKNKVPDMAILRFDDKTGLWNVDYSKIKYIENSGPDHAPVELPPLEEAYPSLESLSPKAKKEAPILPDGKYVFVTMKDGAIRVQPAEPDGSNQHFRVALAAKEVRYTGTIEFENGKIKTWGNQSGAYRCPAEKFENAGLDPQKFIMWSPNKDE